MRTKTYIVKFLKDILLQEAQSYILSVYSLFSNRVGLPLHNTPFPGVLMKIIGAAFFLPDALPDVNHMHGMQYGLYI